MSHLLCRRLFFERQTKHFCFKLWSFVQKEGVLDKVYLCRDVVFGGGGSPRVPSVPCLRRSSPRRQRLRSIARNLFSHTTFPTWNYSNFPIGCSRHRVLRSLHELSERLLRDPDNTDIVAYVSPFAAAIEVLVLTR